MSKQNKTKKAIILGQLREVLAVVGSLYFATVDGWDSLAGLLVAVVAVIWALWEHEGGQVLFTSIRKVLSLAPGVAVGFGWVKPELEPILVSLLLPLLSVVWSYKANGGSGSFKGGGVVPVFFLCILSVSMFTSCGSMVVDLDGSPSGGIRGPLSGVVYEDDGNGGVLPKVDSETLASWFGKITRIAAGEPPKSVLIPQK